MGALRCWHVGSCVALCNPAASFPLVLVQGAGLRPGHLMVNHCFVAGQGGVDELAHWCVLGSTGAQSGASLSARVLC